MPIDRRPDYTVVRTVLFAPPAKPDRFTPDEVQVLLPIRPGNSNKGKYEAILPGGQRGREYHHRTPLNQIASQKLLLETGISIPAEALIPTGRFRHTFTDENGINWVTLSHVFWTELSKHPQRIIMDENQAGLLWVSIVNGEIQTNFRNEFDQEVMRIKLAFNTEKMIVKALSMRNSLRENT